MRFRRLAALAPAFALVAMLLALPNPAEAGLVIQVVDSSATAGGTGSFDVLLINQTGAEADVGGFSVELSVGKSSGVMFTDVTTATSPAYLFGTLQNTPFSYTSFPASDLIAGDSEQDPSSPGYVPVADGATVGLMHVTYVVAPGTAAGPVDVSVVAGDGTQLLDVAGETMDGLTLMGGTIRVSASAVPEPPSVVAMATAAAGGATFSLARRRSRRASRLA